MLCARCLCKLVIQSLSTSCRVCPNMVSLPGTLKGVISHFVSGLAQECVVLKKDVVVPKMKGSRGKRRIKWKFVLFTGGKKSDRSDPALLHCTWTDYWSFQCKDSCWGNTQRGCDQDGKLANSHSLLSQTRAQNALRCLLLDLQALDALQVTLGSADGRVVAGLDVARDLGQRPLLLLHLSRQTEAFRTWQSKKRGGGREGSKVTTIFTFVPELCSAVISSSRRDSALTESEERNQHGHEQQLVHGGVSVWEGRVENMPHFIH